MHENNNIFCKVLVNQFSFLNRIKTLNKQKILVKDKNNLTIPSYDNNFKHQRKKNTETSQKKLS